MEDRGNNDNPVKGVCECSDSKDESSSGECIDTKTISNIKLASDVIAIAETFIAFLVAIINKKLYLFIKFIDNC